jgi:DNA-binding transcriptional ArsR family regulator
MSQEKISLNDAYVGLTVYHTGIAKYTSVEAARVFEVIFSDLRTLKRLGLNFKDGKTWVERSIPQIAAQLDLSYKQVRYALDKLEKVELLEKRKQGEEGWNQAYSYSTDESFLEKQMKGDKFSKEDYSVPKMADQEDSRLICPSLETRLARDVPKAEGNWHATKNPVLIDKYINTSTNILLKACSLIDDDFKKLIENENFPDQHKKELCEFLSSKPERKDDLKKSIAYALSLPKDKVRKSRKDIAIWLVNSGKSIPEPEKGEFDEQKKHVVMYNDFIEKKGFKDIAKFNENELKLGKHIRVVDNSEIGYTTCKWCNKLETLKKDLQESMNYIKHHQEGT